MLLPLFKDYDPASGARINELYEFNLKEGILTHGISFGYSSISAANVSIEPGIVVSTVPIYYALKVMFGSEKARLFTKGTAGMQFAGLKREGVVTFTIGDVRILRWRQRCWNVFITETVFVNAGYEITSAKNNFYVDSSLKSIMGGV